MSDGELLVSLSSTGDTNAGRLYKSSGYGTGTVTWTLKVTCSLGATIEGKWGMSVASPYVLVSEYGLKGSAVKGYFSRDRGNTFTEVLDLTTDLVVLGMTPNNAELHCHGCWVDTYFPVPRIGFVTGDTTANAAVIYSDDFGVTYRVADAAGLKVPQFVWAYPLEHRTLFGTDGAPNGIWTVRREKQSDPMIFRPAEIFDAGTADITVIGSMPFRRAPGYPFLTGFHRSTTGRAAIRMSMDGEDWYPAYTANADQVTGGVYEVVGPTSAGKILAVLLSAAGVYSRISFDAPTWKTIQYPAPKLAYRTSLRCYGVPALTSTWRTPWSSLWTFAATDLLDVRFRIRADSYAPGTDMAIAAHMGAQAAWYTGIRSTGMFFYFYENGVTFKGHNSSVALTTLYNAGQWATLRATCLANNGSAGYTTTYYYSTDYDRDKETGTWTQISTHTSAGASALFNANTIYPEVGGINGGSGNRYAGLIDWVEVRRGTEVIADPWFGSKQLYAGEKLSAQHSPELYDRRANRWHAFGNYVGSLLYPTVEGEAYVEGGPALPSPAANPDTSGATLGNLEIEVNQLKATLRNFGLIGY
jgi:hypothetical protein